MRPQYSRLEPGEGPNFNWENDHTFVKVSGWGTRGAYTLMEDNVKASCTLGLHRHNSHAEVFCFPKAGLVSLLMVDRVDVG